MKPTKAKKPSITLEESCMLRTLCQIQRIKVSTIIKEKNKFPGFSKYSAATLYRHAKKPLDGSREIDRRHQNPGRPKAFTLKDTRRIKRHLVNLRNTMGSFTSNILQYEAGVTHATNSTFRRHLHKMGYGYRKTRRKGLLTFQDFQKRLRFARKVKRVFSRHARGSFTLWTRGISMYVDGVGFEFKVNPSLHSLIPKAREWRLRSEGLICTAKGKKEGQVQVKFLVGIGHNAGVVLCERLTKRMDGKYYAALIRRCFRPALRKTMSPKAARILVDGDPSQNSKKALKAVRDINAKYFKIPARSPDLNPIENLFHLVKKRLSKQAREQSITHESKDEFADRVQNMMLSFKPEAIDKIIETMPKRIDMIIKKRGRRIKY